MNNLPEETHHPYLIKREKDLADFLYSFLIVIKDE